MEVLDNGEAEMKETLGKILVALLVVVGLVALWPIVLLVGWWWVAVFFVILELGNPNK